MNAKNDVQKNVASNFGSESAMVRQYKKGAPQAPFLYWCSMVLVRIACSFFPETANSAQNECKKRYAKETLRRISVQNPPWCAKLSLDKRCFPCYNIENTTTPGE